MRALRALSPLSINIIFSRALLRNQQLSFSILPKKNSFKSCEHISFDDFLPRKHLHHHSIRALRAPAARSMKTTFSNTFLLH